MEPYQRDYIELARRHHALKFGEFTLKSGRVSPYFFNAGAFATGSALDCLGSCYAAAIVASNLRFDMLFGPAYKGIPIAAATAIALYREYGQDTAVAYNRKEAKDHGEGGNVVGGPLQGRVLVLDDVITAGTAVREALGTIRAAGAEPAGLVIGLDREERGATGESSAVQQLERDTGVGVAAIIGMGHIIEYLERENGEAALEALPALREYRGLYGA